MRFCEGSMSTLIQCLGDTRVQPTVRRHTDQESGEVCETEERIWVPLAVCI